MTGVVAIVVGLSPVRARADRPDEPGMGAPSALPVPSSVEAVPASREPLCYEACCEADCIRAGRARWLLLSLGALTGGVAAGVLFGLGDRVRGGDPGSLLFGTGAVAGSGALIGMLFGLARLDGAPDPDRVRPATIGLDSTLGGTQVLDETMPTTLGTSFAPTLFLPHGHGRMRLLGHVRGDLFRRRDVDPRPQSELAAPSGLGNRPVSIEERRISAGLAFDLAVALPYPARRASRTRLGGLELRIRPEIQHRREVVDRDRFGEMLVERTMLLPLTSGFRWTLSPRQRFTFYLGPRFDIVGVPGRDTRIPEADRGRGTNIGPLYGEAWYDVDVPFTRQPRRDGASRRATINGQLTLGYVHSRFDGDGLNFGPVIGFLGPVVLRWTTRVRPIGSKVAFQGALSAMVGHGVAVGAHAGIVLPETVWGQRRAKRVE